MGTSPRHVSQSIYLGKLVGPLGPPGAKQSTTPWAKSSSVVLSVHRHVSNTRSATPAISPSRAFRYLRTSRCGWRPRATTWRRQSSSRSRYVVALRSAWKIAACSCRVAASLDRTTLYTP
nr:hypothetical protein [Human alphaherpesvirus 2]